MEKIAVNSELMSVLVHSEPGTGAACGGRPGAQFPEVTITRFAAAPRLMPFAGVPLFRMSIALMPTLMSPVATLTLMLALPFGPKVVTFAGFVMVVGTGGMHAAMIPAPTKNCVAFGAVQP
jgi:hypothetical protein